MRIRGGDLETFLAEASLHGGAEGVLPFVERELCEFLIWDNTFDNAFSGDTGGSVIDRGRNNVIRP